MAEVRTARLSEQESRALLQRILDSKGLRRAIRLRSFLTYVVDRKLVGSVDEISEVLIGHRVFDRPANYNTGEDSIVRTEALNLRKRLAQYFQGEGQNEPVLLQIPKGTYVPVFVEREIQQNTDESPTSSTASFTGSKTLTLLAVAVALAVLLIVAFTVGRSAKSPRTANVAVDSQAPGRVEFESSDAELAASFRWAKYRALGYAYSGDPVGEWYDSTAGTRNAFCMRNASHQSTGAAALGLTAHTRNMLRRFAASVSSTRAWSGFWEINKDGFAAPVDYKNDKDFWYCLPGNFDVMRACFRQYLWTGDESYFDEVFSNFYDRTAIDYVKAWDLDKDGVMESPPELGNRGIPSYHQEDPRALTAGDLLAAQYQGYLTYASIQEHKGRSGSLSERLAADYRAKAAALRTRYNTEWWNATEHYHYSLLLPNRTHTGAYIPDVNAVVLLFGLPEDGPKTEAALDALEKMRPARPGTLSYCPEVLFQYGRNEAAYAVWKTMLDPHSESHRIPEVVFAAVGAVVTGMAGISPDARNNTVETLPRLPKETAWIRLSHVPVLHNNTTVLHRGATETSFTNENGPALHWKISFPAAANARSPKISVDGASVNAQLEYRLNRQSVISAVVDVQPGQSRVAKYSPDAGM